MHRMDERPGTAPSLPGSAAAGLALPGAAVLAAMMFNEVTAAASPGESRGFFLAVGRRMADLLDLADISSVAPLEARINGLWRMMAWGRAEVVLLDDGIAVSHHHAPAEMPGCTTERWQAIVPVILEGAYDRWFRQLGSGPALTTRAKWQGEAVELRHGI